MLCSSSCRSTNSRVSSCRGILVAGVTNLARTQMAEAFLCLLTRSAGAYIPIQSGGLHFGDGRGIHPLALRVMQDLGLSLQSHSVSTVTAARRQRHTFDVLVSIDAPRCARANTDRSASRYQKLPSVELEDSRFTSALYADDLLFPATPQHWKYRVDATDAREQFNLWSPADPAIAYEGSTRRFQDHIYEGEPLFSRLLPDGMRGAMRLTESWQVRELTHPFAGERQWEHEKRARAVRDDVYRRCVKLLRRLEGFYGEALMLQEVKGDEDVASEVRRCLVQLPESAEA